MNFSLKFSTLNYMKFLVILLSNYHQYETSDRLTLQYFISMNLIRCQSLFCSHGNSATGRLVIKHFQQKAEFAENRSSLQNLIKTNLCDLLILNIERAAFRFSTFVHQTRYEVNLSLFQNTCGVRVRVLNASQTFKI